MKNLLLLVLATVFSAFAAEMGLKILGFKPEATIVFENEPTMHEPDPTLGWINKAGAYHFAPYTPDGDSIRMTFLGTGMRKTYELQENAGDARPKIIFVGGSYTQGWAISDFETYPWKIQESFPTFEVLNFGTGGYGTYQSLLTLERILPLLESPEIVFYGFMEHHEVRNVAPASWMRTLSRIPRRSHVVVPFATMDQHNVLTRHQPQAYTRFPLSDKLTIISLFDQAYVKDRNKRDRRLDQRTPVTEELMLQMSTLARSYGARFVPILLSAPEKTRAHYKRFFELNDMLAFDCVEPLGKEMRVKGEGHPNGVMNSKWASCITDSIYANGLTSASSEKAKIEHH